MKIFDRIKEDLLTINSKIEDMRIGLSYTGVLLDNHNMGVAYTFLPKFHECSTFDRMWPVRGKLVYEIVKDLSLESDIISAIFLACANAFYNIPQRSDYITKDVLSIVDLTKTDIVGMVGEFKPLVEPIKTSCQNLYIFERNRKSREEILSEEHIHILRRCDVVIITATSIINQTIDFVLENINKAREVVILGPSTPLNPVYFMDTPVTLLCGVIVSDISSVLEIISLGGGMRSFNRFVKKVGVRCGK